MIDRYAPTGLAEKINAIREEYETYDWTRADVIRALCALGISRRRAELEVKTWRK